METRKYWIVVVDDDTISLKNAREMLSGGEMRISAVRSGKELLVFIQKNRPDIILLDVMMPDMDGFETYKKLREYEDQEGLNHTPVIFLTGENDSESEQKGLMIGASDFIRKPINRDVLLRRIQNIITNREAIENLTEEATTDKLTGFYNKAYAESKMVQVCKEKKGTLVILDLDSFKLVNDLYGHDMGDNVLSGFAGIARHNCREKDILCRIGGDEFLAFFMDLIDENVVSSYVTRLNEQLVDACVEMMGEEFNIPIGVSAGCVIVNESGDYSALFQLADKALYQVKQNGKHDCRFYDIGKIEESDEMDPQQELRRMITLCEERGQADNAMLLGQDAFISVYRYMNRFARRHNEEVVKVLVYLTADEEFDGEEFMDAMYALGIILQENFRKNDVITKNRHDSYFLLLSKYNLIDVDVVMDRVKGKWEHTKYCNRFKVNSVGTIGK